LNNTFFKTLNISKASFDPEITLRHSKADSGGMRDYNFLMYLIDNKLLRIRQCYMKRTNIGAGEEYFMLKYKKFNYESDRHFLCRAAIKDEIVKMGFAFLTNIEKGDLNILRSTANYDIVTADSSTIIDIGLTPARNYFKGLTDLKIQGYLYTPFFDDYMDDILFTVFTRGNDKDFLDAVAEYEERYKTVPTLQSEQYMELDN